MAEVVIHGQDPSGVPGVLNAVTIDSEGNLHVAADMSFGAEVEIVGEPVLNRRFTASAAGNNTILTAPAGQLIQVFSAKLSVSANISGEVILETGSGNTLGGIWNPQSGGLYLFFGAGADYEQTAIADTLVVNLPAAQAVTVNVTYRLTTEVSS
ncbi:MAG: hypothetical protein ABSC19_05025 [Syntrophorhabdales bacterium]|jgi:hypothetical protein